MMTRARLTREEQILVVGLGAVLVCQLGVWPLAAVSGTQANVISFATRSAIFGLTALLAITTWVLLFLRHTLPAGIVWLIMSVDAFLVFLGGLITPAGDDLGYAHPSLPSSIGIASLVMVGVGVRTAWPMLALVVVGWLAGVADTLLLGIPALSAAGTNLATLMLVPLGAGLVVRGVASARRSEANARAALAAAHLEIAESRTREEERGRQYRTVHDTVLSTLSALSRGTLDPTQPEIRHRLSYEADYLRGLIATSTSTAGMQLVGELARLTREHAPAGLRVHPHISDVPNTLPLEVVRALAAAIQESLNNVIKHAGTLEAWVTIVGDDKGVAVTVTDRGRGFDTTAPMRGFGVRSSIKDRLAEVGGSAQVFSGLGEGTTVELRWPA